MRERTGTHSLTHLWANETKRFELARSNGAATFGISHLDADAWKELTAYVGGTLGSHYLLGSAMAAVGLSTSAAALKGVGPAPFAVGFASAVTVGCAGFCAASLCL